MKCDICNREFANSEEMKAHVERDHTLEERGEEDGLEKPDLLGSQEERAPIIPGKNN